jgi:hypothetical protein
MSLFHQKGRARACFPEMFRHRALGMRVARSKGVTWRSIVGPVATRDRELIASWAARHQAKPATAEATCSGPATVDVHDSGAAIRFNFPGFGRFQPITWDEWFQNFDRDRLTFVYEESSESAWAPSPRYRIVKTEDWNDLIE